MPTLPSHNNSAAVLLMDTHTQKNLTQPSYVVRQILSLSISYKPNETCEPTASEFKEATTTKLHPY